MGSNTQILEFGRVSNSGEHKKLWSIEHPRT